MKTILLLIILCMLCAPVMNAEPPKESGGASLPSLNGMQVDTDHGTDYTDIYRQASGKLREEDIGRISVLIWELHLGMDNEWMVVDFEKKAVYGGIGFDLGKCQEEHRLADLSGKDAAFIRETAAATGMTGWDNLHILNGKDTMDGNVDWTIGIRLDSGECIKYEETGYVEYDAPEDAGVTFCWTLWTHFTESRK